MTHLNIIYKGFITDSQTLFARNDCWVSDGQDELLPNLQLLKVNTAPRNTQPYFEVKKTRDTTSAAVARRRAGSSAPSRLPHWQHAYAHCGNIDTINALMLHQHGQSIINVIARQVKALPQLFVAAETHVDELHYPRCPS